MSDRDEKGQFLPAHNQPGPGRDSLYDTSMNDQARKLALLGLTDAEIAEFFGVTERTLNNWKNEFPAFFQSLNAGKVQADADVADSLYRRAVGEVVFVEKRVKVAEGEYDIIRLSQKIPADPGAAKLWLTNRQPDKWREKQQMQLTGPDGSDGEPTAIQVTIVDPKR
ncbi:helix-turn-helix domain-containing protein [Brucella sp. 6810]|uniref:helix-turn-helix domain-containing protein n=1 Tax=Brucella sp. 6810 TaxID=2769351 RepID=UPI00165B2EAC|nr:helix-turn-helix domain-containing protein [Brucella sp. 6810]QNQ62506.1 helix-turn-helix domain-containing protein [Brucella sp. 6810]